MPFRAVLAVFRAIIRRLSADDLGALRARFVALHEGREVIEAIDAEVENRGDLSRSRPVF